MRYVTVIVHPDGGAFHPVGERLGEDSGLTREAIHAVERLDDGTIAMLTEVRGDLDRYRDIMADSPEVHEYAVSGDGSGYCYCRVEPSPLTERLMAHSEAGEFVVEYPVEVTDDGGHRVTMVGREEDFARAFSGFPDAVDVEVESTGPYHPDADRVFSSLTDRQREVLETAIRLGYYENPREATHEDVAAAVGVEPGTVGKHLRNVEARVFSEYVL
jgi:predicted DNA binding protein